MRQGHLLNERYKIIKKIGSGGMAEVYLARDTILERDVAIKALRSEYINDTEFITRFDREAQAATSLTHPNIVNIFDVGEEEDILYMVMEYVDGLTLKEYIQQQGPIEVNEAVDIVKQISSAIAHAHDNDIVHRDIKPQNILMNSFGQAKVTDFGIAIALSATSLTQTNSILGSVHYLSPEQARGGMATKKSDIYSIGILFYELLTGRLPFSGQSPVSIALKHLQSKTPSIRQYNPHIPQSVENIVLKATAKDPFHRYQSIYELEDAINHALDPDRLNEPPYEPPVEVGEETRAIPIITDDQFHGSENEETIISKPNGTTKAYPPEADGEGKKKKDKKPKEKKKKSRKKKWLLILSILFVLLAATAVVLFFVPGILLPKDVELIDVVGEEYEDAKEQLENLNLIVEQKLTFSDEVEEGHVVSMDPTAGRTVKEESTVTLTVSEGKERFPMEDYVGQDLDQVIQILEGEGFDPENILTVEKHSDQPSGEITDQLQPSPDTEVIPSETRVIFEVSIGPELISLNNLTGMTEEEAKDYLDRNNLVFQKREEDSDNVEEGKVIRQSPESGTELEEGASVDVYISTGPREIPPTSHRITLTVPYTGINEDEETEEENPEEETPEEPVEQTVRIYIGDVNNNVSDVYEELTITEDTPVTFTLLIAYNDEAEYIITRDDEIVTNDVVSYEEGD
ncbi:Stk1 family PASTA domain-containing Ser/Thr kinase [Oceanobacillus alkalisoli]|uniref:Stk1 family PASTA domain-containing Ser/Thr kinase n=1 Tax=Oceanobacillus alkalisoli TaxID=2925113 RepID=UPI001EF02240|nr:Stk1 family PASTA domain-containing Ser/Thr kinase [Oceanobacillus alkalisoli]MCF3942480.1 Stk1 family PASTA domain-containing Ser/Thr kinase [Oceanobacillus alkalisoli]MCG5103537.1 Stk1 family PASTA domain-containing Ser/Thr kinase [Oceanobacillus alkalisoli]